MNISKVQSLKVCKTIVKVCVHSTPVFLKILKIKEIATDLSIEWKENSNKKIGTFHQVIMTS